MPTMKKDPWAKLTMRVTPKINERPAATRNSEDAPANPLSNGTTKPEKLMKAPEKTGDPAPRRAQEAAADALQEPCGQSAGRIFFTSSSVGWNLAPSRYT